MAARRERLGPMERAVDASTGTCHGRAGSAPKEGAVGIETSDAGRGSAGTEPPKFGAYAGARVAITGGLGSIGSPLPPRLVALGPELPLLDSLLPSSGANP